MMYGFSLSRHWHTANTLAGKKSQINSLGWLQCWVGLIAAMCLAWPANGEDVATWLDGDLPRLVDLYRDLHQSPELSFQEEKTAAKMAEVLKQAGFEVTEKVGGYGVMGVLKNGSGKTLLLRADMDALPVAEETGLPYASQVRTKDERGATVGVMHACGHDMHMINLVGAVQYLASHRDTWQGTLVAIFQPAEERGAGARAMIADGLLVRFPRPHYALAMHVSAEHPTGIVCHRAGYAQANVDSVDINMKGRGGHGARPEGAIDPVVIAAKLVVDLQTIVSREIKPIEPAVITVGSIHGGTKHNIIGDSCALQITVRSYSQQVREQLIAAIRRKTLAAAASADAPEPEIEVSEGTPSLFNDPELTAQVVAALKPALGDKNVQEVEPSMGGEDFGRIGRAGVPIVMLKLGVVDQERLDQYRKDGTPPPSLHSAQFYPDPEKSIATGVTTFVTAVQALLPK